ncbi:Ubiquitin-conjugating enzyme/RWD-like protein [Pseudocohnilembus persalinus]|uniref:Ubiquitin-conjugating enzyme/RWD-like protein n=1 Tax=Pseudocohnilembus persalinus TaxID=266149 RepID=A0A0V0QF41_PSEPJ|nr:Ubiquitin-conjugating enzyme/RWD-like protein [Pseudocohnilembus persalinus]|eukprot:KRX00779.1 Ubiquitin-conjugating enzyme/RWD-like protein [Pseudocohnilembus persalinus]
MNKQQQQNQAIKRLFKDLKDLEQEPLKGVGICIPNNENPRTLRVNIEILDGPFSGCIVPHYMRILETFPNKPPQMIIDKGFPNIHPLMMSYSCFFKMEEDAKIDAKDCNSYCLDILETHAFQEIKKAGWSSAYTIKTLLIQIQALLGDSHMYSQYFMNGSDKKKQEVRQFQQKIKLQNGKTVIHSQDNPFPAISDGIPKKSENQQSNQSANKKLPQDVIERLTCYLTRDSILDDEKIIFGYPIKSVQDKFQRVQMESFGEVLSLDGFLQQKNLQANSRKTAGGEIYNGWIPLYINEEHFKRAKNYIQDIGQYIFNQSTNDYKDYIIIFPKLLNKLVVSMFNFEGQIGVAQIEMYCQFQKLFRRLIEDEPKLQQEINKRVKQMIGQDDKIRNKKSLADIGDFIALVGFSDYNLTDILPIIYKEYFARQVFWIFKNKEGQRFQNTQALLSFAYTQAAVSNNILLFNVGVQKYLGTEEFQKSLEERYSFIKQQDAENFLKELKFNAKNIKNHIDLQKYVGLINDQVNLDFVAYQLDWFKVAVNLSNSQGYTKNLKITNLVSGSTINQQQLRYQQIFEDLKNKQIYKKQDLQENNKQVVKQNNNTTHNNSSIISPDLSNLQDLFKNLNSPCDIYVQIPSKDKDFQQKQLFQNFLQNNNDQLNEKFSLEQIEQDKQLIYKIQVKPPRQNALDIVKILLQNLYIPKLVPKTEKPENLTFLFNNNIDFINDLVQVQKDEKQLDEQFKNLNKKHDIFLYFSDNLSDSNKVQQIIKSQNVNNIKQIENLGYIIDVKPPRDNAKQICLNLIKQGHQPILKPSQN